MLGRRELRELALRRQELVIQSNINRLLFRVELQNVRTGLRPAERIIASARAARPWLMILAPLAGIFVARRLRHNGATFSKALGLLKWIQPLFALWKQFAPRSAETTPEPRQRR